MNALYVLGFVGNGDGCTEAARLLGLLGLPNDTTMQSRSFGIIEDRMSPFIQSVTRQILLEILKLEVKRTYALLPDKDDNDYELWTNSLGDNASVVLSRGKYPEINVSFDMGWQQRSSGKKYASPTGHAFFVGGLCCLPLHFILKSKICNYCSTYKKKHGQAVEVPVHRCTINHEGTSGGMEAIAALELVVSLFDEFHVVVKVICLDDDTSTRSLLKWSNADHMKNNNTTVMPQAPKTKGKNKGDLQPRKDNGRLPGHIPEPQFVADPNHRKKVLTKQLRAMLAMTVDKKHTLAATDVLRIGKSFGYMIRGLKHLTEDQYISAADAVLEHHFDNHDHCGVWCPRKRLSQLQRTQSDRYYRCKTRDAKLYNVLKQMISRFITLPNLREVAHSFDTQVNESLNNSIAWLAPKNKCYGGSQSLCNRISIAIGVNSLGVSRYYAKLFKALSITMTPNVIHYLEVKQNNRKKRIDKCKTSAKKKARNVDIFNKIRLDEIARKKDLKKNSAAIYKSGMNMEDAPEDGEEGAKPPPAKKMKTNHKDSICPHCGRKGHVLRRSKHCLYRDGIPQQSDIPATAAAQDPITTAANDAADDVDGYDGLSLQGDNSADADDETAEVQLVGRL